MSSKHKPEPTKSECPITAEKFAMGAKSLIVTIGGQQFVAEPKEFSTGSFGWYVNAKMVAEVDGQPLKVSIGANLTVVGSKEAARK